MANGHGGHRDGAGRKRRPAYVPDGELTPLEHMLAILRDEHLPSTVRMDACKAAAPYCHARLQNTQLDVDADLHITLVSYLDLPAESET